MHDPEVVAFEIRRPWPHRVRYRNISASDRPRLDLPYVAALGRWWFFPEMITVWHVEPGGHDSGTVCPWSGRWRWHVWHWRLQVIPLQEFRRWALTRCAGCGGRSTRGRRVNVRLGGGPRAPWWRGERNLYHLECRPHATGERHA
jgi:hypothetical protein